MLSRTDALNLALAGPDSLPMLLARAAARRDRAWGRTLTYSPKVFLPLTNVCRSRCDYCSFRRSPGDEGEWTMSPDEVVEWLERGREQGCVEALFCLGDNPDVFPAYRERLAAWGFGDTVEYLVWACEQAIERGLLPHTNAGLLDGEAMLRLRAVNVSLGLMLESVSERLCERGMPHAKAPDKRPAKRVAMTREAGALRIPFTSGLLIGIGETPEERVDTLLAIRELHEEHGHIQEVIVQNFRAHGRSAMAGAPEPASWEMAQTIALARLILPDEVSVQAPPNLNTGDAPALIAAGVNDFGGISPVTPDYINPGHPWPHIDGLAAQCAELGFELAPRLPVYERYLAGGDHWVECGLLARCKAIKARLHNGVRAAQGHLVDADSPARGATREVRRKLEACLAGDTLRWEDGAELLRVTGSDLHALCRTADRLRAEQVGEVVTYVVNRNINFTNVCVKDCGFCAFSRTLRDDDGYLIDVDEVVRRARQAQEYGATEVCVQAGLAPTSKGRLYIDLCRALHEALPDLHLHAFSPEEIKYGAGLARMPFTEYLAELKAVGLGSLPGTSAEILDDTVRARIAAGRISTTEWIEVITTAHRLGIPTTATMMFGHVETPEDQARHLALLRSIQRETGGFTELVPLSFVHTEAPMYAKAVADGVPMRPGPSGLEVIRVYAVARLLLGRDIPNLQASWVKEGLRMTQWLLQCGVNDVGGTLINESISTQAGAQHGQMVTPRTLRALIRGAGRTPAQRNTRYEHLRVFADERGDEVASGEGEARLEAIEDTEAVFGSYDALAADERFRYRPERLRAGATR